MDIVYYRFSFDYDKGSSTFNAKLFSKSAPVTLCVAKKVFLVVQVA